LINRSVLDNGLVVVSERTPGSQVCGVGVWLRSGSADEAGWPAGITHLFEHMVFKGTTDLTAKEIAARIEHLGATLNASTGRNSTTIYTNSLCADWKICLETMSLMLVDSSHQNTELSKELSVILDEIKMVEELPEEELYDLAFQDMFPDSCLGHPVLGFEDSVKSVKRDTLLNFSQENLCGNRIVVSLAGDVSHEEVLDQVNRWFGHLPRGKKPLGLAIPDVSPGLKVHKRQNALQAHIQFGRCGPEIGSAAADALAILNTLLGDGMSSKLFQKLREDLGLCYNVYSWGESIGRSSVHGAYFACEANNQQQVLDYCIAEYEQMLNGDLDLDELQRITRQLKCGMLLGLEQNMNRMIQLARTELDLEKAFSLEERFARLDKLGIEDFQDAAVRWLNPAGFCISKIIPQRSVK
jgi:predicted Zn-dependent peptidase